MSKLYQFTSIFIIILFFTGCGGSISVQQDPDKIAADKIRSINISTISAMSTDEKINYAEKLYEYALSSTAQDGSEKSILLGNALLACTQILVDAQQLKLSRGQTAFDISSEQYKYSLQLNSKIMEQLNIDQLSHDQKNQYLLASAATRLSHNQIEEALAQLNMDFDSTLNEQWSLYYQMRAMAKFQLGRQSKAVKELIIRHGHLITENEQQANLNLIWSYLSGIDLNKASQKSSLITATEAPRTMSDSDDIYSGWLKLMQILRDPKDPQTMNHAINFWLQSYPSHQANRTFINRIIQIRQTSILNVRHIAVLLPLQGKLAKPAKAIRDGIMASHYASPISANLQLRFYDTNNDQNILFTYQQAIDDGADFVIGPLAKSNVKVLSHSVELSVPTLALNSLETTVHSPELINSPEQANSPEPINSPEIDNNHELNNQAESINPDSNPDSAIEQLPINKSGYLFQFGLSPESAARMVAEKGRQDGHYYAAVMSPDNLWGKRMKNAFSAHWEKSGGVVVDAIEYHSQDHDFSDTIKSMLNIELSESRKNAVSRTIGRKLEFTPRRRQDIDMLFMAAFPRQAKQIPLQVIYHHGETIPIYSTAHIVETYHNARQNIDMDGVNFSDMPFLLDSNQDAISQQNTYQSTLYQRLFAMGVDSYQLAPHINYLYKNPSESFSGDTGKITINHDGHIVRSMPWATFDQGNIKLQNSPFNSNDNASLN